MMQVIARHWNPISARPLMFPYNNDLSSLPGHTKLAVPAGPKQVRLTKPAAVSMQMLTGMRTRSNDPYAVCIRPAHDFLESGVRCQF